MVVSKTNTFYKFNLNELPDELYKDSVPIEKWLEICSKVKGSFEDNSLNKMVDIDPMVEWERIFGISLWMVGNVAVFACFGLGIGALFSVWFQYAFLGFVVYVAILWAVEELYFKPHFLRVYGHKDYLSDKHTIRENQYLFTERNTSKYVNTTIVWPESVHRPALKDQAVIFAVIPHGAAPLGATAYPIWSKIWSDKLCHFTCAPILFQLPVISYFMKSIGYIPAKSKQILETLQKKEESVGIFLDGIAGMFQKNDIFGDSLEERAYVAKRKGIVKIALRAGVPIIPVYAFGHTSAYTVVVDPFGFLEYLSNALETSLTPMFGRWGWFLGPPKRVPVTLALGEPIHCPLTQEPTKEEIHAYHAKMVAGFEAVFNQHKAAYGWSGKKLKIV